VDAGIGRHRRHAVFKRSRFDDFDGSGAQFRFQGTDAANGRTRRICKSSVDNKNSSGPWCPSSCAATFRPHHCW
jgi:hypothetical protein